jgi:hypothetical protein
MYCYCTQKLYKYETCACYVIATSPYPYHIFDVIYYPIINFIQPLSLLWYVFTVSTYVTTLLYT